VVAGGPHRARASSWRTVERRPCLGDIGPRPAPPAHRPRAPLAHGPCPRRM